MSRGLKNSSARNIRWKWVQLAHTPARRQFIRAPMRQKSNPCMKGPSKDYTWSCGPAWGLPVMPESHQAVCTSWCWMCVGGSRTHRPDHRSVADARQAVAAQLLSCPSVPPHALAAIRVGEYSPLLVLLPHHHCLVLSLGPAQH